MDPYLGEVRMFAGNFAPVGWALCNGQLLPISENDALYSLLGTTYGGDGQNTFGLPDLRGRSPIHMGQGPSLSDRVIGDMLGSETAAMSVAQLPAHTHALSATGATGTAGTAVGNAWAASSTGSLCYATGASPVGAMAALAIGATGANLPHENMMPFQVVNFIIATAGIYPTQS
jgi:microcystin-dependent protein